VALLAQGPAVQMVRRHARSSHKFHYGPALQTVSGNYVAAKRKGVVNGVDFMSTGSVSAPVPWNDTHVREAACRWTGVPVSENMLLAADPVALIRDRWWQRITRWC
jgi:hypothetical protein